MSSRLLLALAATLAAVGTVSAAPRSIADCESIQAADAYNRCLASFGPAARGLGRSRIEGAPQPLSSRTEEGSGVRIEHGRRGRARMVLTPKR